MANELDVFNAEPPTNDAPMDLTLNDLVGEGRKYKDPDELAKAYANAEAHLRRLEADNADTRAKLDQIEAAKNTTNNPQQTGQEQPPKADQQPTTPNQEAPKPSGQDVDFRSKIREEVAALNEQERAKANTEAAALRMISAYGDAAKANEAVQRRAQELGVSVDWLRDSASRSPEAFYATMGMTNNHSSSTPASEPGVRRDTQGTNVKNFEHFDRIRKEDPKRYFSVETQRDMLNQARAMGSDFYKR